MIIRNKPHYLGVKIRLWLKSRRWSPDIFQPVTGLSADSPFDLHVAWAFKHIYQKPYPQRDAVTVTLNLGIERLVHGITHTTRAALYVPVWINFYRKLGNQAALQLTDEDLRLLKIAVLLHDAANCDEHGGKAGDADSGLVIYLYLTRVLNLSPETAKLFSEAVANKEPDAKEYWSISEDKEDIHLQCTQIKKIPFTIYQCIIHDADCLDIIRARPHFIAELLCIYDDLAKPQHRYVLLEVAHLICEARSLIDKQGDTYCHINSKIKKHYENQHAYKRMMADLDANQYPILHTLHAKLFTPSELAAMSLVETVEYNPDAGLTDSNLAAAMREGRVFARGLVNATHHYTKSKTNAPNETHGEEDFRKIMRAPEIATVSSKSSRFFKSGFKQRAASMLGFGAGVFYGAGYLVIDPAPTDVTQVDSIDANSGFRKKAKRRTVNRVRIENDLAALQQSLLSGGDSARIRYFNCAANHNEVTLDINKVDAIFFCNDRTLSNLYHGLPDALPQHKYSQLLIAVYLRTIYAKAYAKQRLEFIAVYGEQQGDAKFRQRFGENPVLPLFEYSSTHHFIRQIPEDKLNEASLIHYWVELCGNYMEDTLFKPQKATTISTFIHHQNVRFYSRFVNVDELQDMSLAHLKFVSLFGHMILDEYDVNTPDCCMPPTFISKLDAALNEKRRAVVDKYFTLANELACSPALLRSMRYSGVDLITTPLSNLKILIAVYNGNFASLEASSTLGIAVAPAILGTALLQAVANRQYDAVKWLLDHGAAVNHQTSCGETPLHMAAEIGSAKMVKLLSLYGATHSVPNDAGLTPLHFAINKDDIDTARQLLIEGADPDGGLLHPITPLCVAANQGNLAIAQLLVTRGACIAFKNVSVVSAVVEAIFNNHTELALYLINVARPSELNITDGYHSTELTAAILYSNKLAIKALLTRDCLLHTQDDMIAKFSNENYQVLLETVIEVDALNKRFTFSGETFLEFANNLAHAELHEMIDRMTNSAVIRHNIE